MGLNLAAASSGGIRGRALLALAAIGLLLATACANENDAVPRFTRVPTTSTPSDGVATPVAAGTVTPVPTSSRLALPEGLFVLNSDGSDLQMVWEGSGIGQTWSPDGKALAFIDRDPGHRLYVLDLATNEVREVGTNTEWPVAWSPDGGSLLMSVRVGPPASPSERFVEVVDVVSGERRRLAAGIYGEWSPDGTRVAFSGPECERRFDWRTVDLATGEVSDVLPAYPDAPVFISPDWTQVAYFKDPIREDDPYASRPLYVADIDGSNERRLPTGGVGWGWPGWSPDGKWLTYSAPVLEGGFENPRPYLVPSDGSAEPLALAEKGYAHGWSSDSSLLEVHASGPSRAFLYNVNSGERVTVWDGVVPGSQWSPDGSKLAFTAPAPQEDRSDLYVYEVATGSVRKLTDDPVYAALPKWSPDGQRIAFLGIRGGFDYGPCL